MKLTVNELERWHAAYDKASLEGKDPEQAVALADGSSPTVKLSATSEAIHQAEARLQFLNDAVRKLELVERNTRGRISTVQDSLRFAFPHPDFRAEARWGSDVGLPVESRHIEVTVTPQEIKELAWQKAQIKYYEENVVPLTLVRGGRFRR